MFRHHDPRKIKVSPQSDRSPSVGSIAGPGRLTQVNTIIDNTYELCFNSINQWGAEACTRNLPAAPDIGCNFYSLTGRNSMMDGLFWTPPMRSGDFRTGGSLLAENIRFTDLWAAVLSCCHSQPPGSVAFRIRRRNRCGWCDPTSTRTQFSATCSASPPTAGRARAGPPWTTQYFCGFNPPAIRSIFHHFTEI